jgi:hypothetical protein
MRQRFNFETGQWESVNKYSHRESIAPAVFGDTIDAVRSNADGRWYDSKSQMRKGAKAAGCYEVGPNDRLPERRVQKIESPKETLIRLFNGG